ncbi:MAG: caspase family protein [Patescibacteria group bacterium]
MKYHILSIGISKHQHSFVNTLQFADKDATDFYTLFTSNISDIGYKKLLINSEATLTEIRTALGKELRQAVGSDDAFFFFFSGHGSTAENQDGTSLEHYFIPFDATPDIPSSAVSIDYLKEVFDKINCKAAYIFVDTCFSGSINSKGYSYPNTKALKDVKALSDQVFGRGSLVFTASKSDEKALEDPDNQNGLFTYFVLNELQKQRNKDRYPVTDIVTPVIEEVTKRAKSKYNHTQTPTAKINLEGAVYLPICGKPLKIPPTLLHVPKYPQLATTTFPISVIELSDKQLQKQLNEMVSFVVNGNNQQGNQQKILFERFCWKMIKQVRSDWDRIFNEVGSDVSKIPNAVVQLEAAAYQLILLGSITSTFGSEEQMKIYSDVVTTILDWEKGRAGLTALIAAPEILPVVIIYTVGVVCLANNNLKPLKILLYTKVQDSNSDGEPLPLFMYNHMHYCDALGGYGSKVADHVRSLLQTYTWLPELSPRLEDKVVNYQLQINFIISILIQSRNERFWPDFGRFYASRIRPLVDKIKYDQDFQKQLASLFEVNAEKIRQVIITNFSKIKQEEFGGGFFWESITHQALLTKEELEEARKNQVREMQLT